MFVWAPESEEVCLGVEDPDDEALRGSEEHFGDLGALGPEDAESCCCWCEERALSAGEPRRDERLEDAAVGAG